MLQNIKKRKLEEGFTIIEVLIVLAIAGLILLIVFLAVPTLQRNSRNTGRKEDAGRLASAINDFVSNNSGALPTNTNWGTNASASPATNCQTIETDAGTLNQYTSASTPCMGTATPSATTAGFYESDSGAITGAAAVNVNEIILSEGAVCLAGTPNQTTTTGATTRTAAILYTLESGGSAWTWNCQNIQ